MAGGRLSTNTSHHHPYPLVRLVHTQPPQQQWLLLPRAISRRSMQQQRQQLQAVVVGRGLVAQPAVGGRLGCLHHTWCHHPTQQQQQQ